MKRATPHSIDEYIEKFDPSVQAILQNIRGIVKSNVPEAVECIGYQMPAFRKGKIFIYFAAFKKHIGIYPPVKTDPLLIADLSRYRGEKGNLSFPLNEPMPYPLIERVVKALCAEID